MLRERKVQQEVLGHTVPSTNDTLPNYRKVEKCVSVASGQFPCVILTDDDTVPGLVLEVRGAEPQAFDRYETAAYTRTRVKLGSGREAWIYLKT